MSRGLYTTVELVTGDEHQLKDSQNNHYRLHTRCIRVTAGNTRHLTYNDYYRPQKNTDNTTDQLLFKYNTV